MFAVYLPVILSCDYFCSDYILWMKFGIESDQNGCPDLDFRFHGVLFRESRCLSYQLWMRLSPFSFLHWWDVLTFMNIFGCVRVQGCYDLWMCAGRWLVMYCLSRQWYFPDYIGCVICLLFCPSIVNCFLLWFYTVCWIVVNFRPSVGWYPSDFSCFVFILYSTVLASNKYQLECGFVPCVTRHVALFGVVGKSRSTY